MYIYEKSRSGQTIGAIKVHKYKSCVTHAAAKLIHIAIFPRSVVHAACCSARPQCVTIIVKYTDASAKIAWKKLKENIGSSSEHVHASVNLEVLLKAEYPAQIRVNIEATIEKPISEPFLEIELHDGSQIKPAHVK